MKHLKRHSVSKHPENVLQDYHSSDTINYTNTFSIETNLNMPSTTWMDQNCLNYFLNSQMFLQAV